MLGLLTVHYFFHSINRDTTCRDFTTFFYRLQPVIFEIHHVSIDRFFSVLNELGSFHCPFQWAIPTNRVLSNIYFFKKKICLTLV